MLGLANQTEVFFIEICRGEPWLARYIRIFVGGRPKGRPYTFILVAIFSDCKIEENASELPCCIMPRMDVEELKQQAGFYAADFVQSGMVIGLGSGSTAIHATRRIAQHLASGDLRDIVGIPSSRATEAAAINLGIPLATLGAHPVIDITIDGADEIDPAFNLIKGGGGAHLREKIVAQASQRFIIVADESKLSEQLGSNWAVPIEVLPFGWQSQAIWLESIGGSPRLRQAGSEPTITDQGNFILDCDFGAIADAAELARRLKTRAGIIEHGLFIGMTRDVIVAGEAGVEHLRR